MATTHKAYKGPAMEGVIASWYSRITRRDRGYSALVKTIAAHLPAGARVLEVAPGETGREPRVRSRVSLAIAVRRATPARRSRRRPGSRCR
jgi:hypothetical protein